MAERLSRRELLSVKALRQIFGAFTSGRMHAAESGATALEQYFQSPLHSYPLLQEMPLEMLVAEAQSRGIPVKGRSKHEIARDLFMKTGQAE